MTNVILLSESYQQTTTWDSTTGTKIFVDASVLPDLTPVLLPVLGAEWDADFFGLRASSITWVYISDDPACGKKYTVQYSTAPAPSETIGIYPTTVEMSADFQTYSDSKEEGVGVGHWEWSDGKRATELKRRTREITTTIVVHKWVVDEDDALNDFMAISKERVGKVNTSGTTNINGITVGKEQVLYLGFNASESQDAEGVKKWDCTLKFVLKLVPNPDGGGYVGWNYIYRPATNKYNKVVFNPGGDGAVGVANLYEAIEFNSLLT